MAKTEENRKISDEIVNPTLDLSFDYSELVLDSILDEGLLKEIPVIKTIVSTYKIGTSIRDKHFTKKLCIFLKELHSNKLDKAKLEQFKDKFNCDTKYREKVMENIVVMNDRFVDNQKSKILANLFVSYIEEKIDWDDYLELNHCLEQLSPKTLLIFHELAELDFIIPNGHALDTQSIRGILMSAGILSTMDGSNYSFRNSISHDLYVMGKMENIA